MLLGFTSHQVLAEMPPASGPQAGAINTASPFIHMYMQQGARFPPHQSLPNGDNPHSQREGTKEHTLFKRSTSRTRTVFANSGEGNLPGSSLTIYFHRRSANRRQAKFTVLLCYGVGSFTATFPVGALVEMVCRKPGLERRALRRTPLHPSLLTHH